MGHALQLRNDSLAPLAASERHRAISTARHCPANAPVAATFTSHVRWATRLPAFAKSVFPEKWMDFRVFTPGIDIRNDTQCFGKR